MHWTILQCLRLTSSSRSFSFIKWVKWNKKKVSKCINSWVKWEGIILSCEWFISLWKGDPSTGPRRIQGWGDPSSHIPNGNFPKYRHLEPFDLEALKDLAEVVDLSLWEEVDKHEQLAHVAWWIEHMFPKQKVVGLTPTCRVSILPLFLIFFSN